MPSEAYNYFRLDVSAKEYKCNWCDYTSPAKNPKASNMLRHSERIHIVEVTAARKKREMSQKRQQSLNFTVASSSALNSNAHSAPLPRTKKLVQTKIDDSLTIKPMSMGRLIKACVKIVTKSGRPFSFMDDEGFREIIEPILDAIPRSVRKPIDARTIPLYVNEEASRIREIITNNLKGKPFCLKMDCATRKQRSFLGINAQTIFNGEIIIFTLAVHDVTDIRHTALNLKNLVEDILKKYSLSINQVFAITVDNGANMTACVNSYDHRPKKKKTRKRKATSDISLDRESIGNSDDDTDDRLFHLQEFGSDDEIVEIEVQEVEEVEESNDNEITEEEILEDFNQNNSLYQIVAANAELDFSQITCIRCIAHTMQLVVLDTLKVEKYCKVIKTVRTFVKKMRTPTYRDILRIDGIPIPKIDCVTRWSSSNIMVDSVTDHKEYYVKKAITHKDFALPPNIWALAEEMTKALKYCKEATLKFQTVQFTLVDAFRVWNVTLRQTKKIDSEFAQLLAKNLEDRAADIFKVSCYSAAILLDPRVSPVIESADIKKSGIDFLVHVYKLTKNLLKTANDLTEEDTSGSESPKTASGSAHISNSCENIEEEFLRELAEKRKKSSNSRSEGSNNDSMAGNNDISIFQAAVEAFLNLNLEISFDRRILEVWHSIASNNAKEVLNQPALKTIADIALLVLSTPCTQCSVERVFSALKYILNDLRMNLKDSNVENILLVRCNQNL